MGARNSSVVLSIVHVALFLVRPFILIYSQLRLGHRSHTLFPFVCALFLPDEHIQQNDSCAEVWSIGRLQPGHGIWMHQDISVRSHRYVTWGNRQIILLFFTQILIVLQDFNTLLYTYGLSKIR